LASSYPLRPLTHVTGTKIVAQSPPGCIVSAEGVDRPPLFDFDVLQEYIIPKPAFFNRYITVNDPEGKHAVLGFPVSIAHPKYDRNEFIFNFGVVVEADVEQIPYERVVRRLASTFAEMEKQNDYLSLEGRAARDDGRRPIGSLLEIVKEDLNNYGECMIPVDDANTINMKLFPHHPSPPQVKGWHVPVAKMKLADIVDPTWDLTLQKVTAHIDGCNDVRRIAFLADVGLELAATALRHLLYYDTILLLDMFFFSACYAPRAPGIHDFIANADGLADECAAYACPGARLSAYDLGRLMASFCVGRSVAEWLRHHLDAGLDVLRLVDVRRLVQFGVIKGVLYRVHKFVVSKQYLASLATGQAGPRPGGDPLQRYTDGAHCFDQIITEQNLTDGEIMDKLKSFPNPVGDLTVFFK
jgi:nitrogen permease regulator 2-like protein